MTLSVGTLLARVFALIVTTALHPFLNVLAPVVVWIGARNTRDRSLLLAVGGLAVLVTCAASIAHNEWNPINNGLSILYILAFVSLLLVSGTRIPFDVHAFIRVVTGLLLANSVVGFGQFAMQPHDDAFIGFYGRSGLRGHGLAVLYMLFFTYYACRCIERSTIANMTIALVMFVSWILCFYGVSLMVFAMAAAIVGLRFVSLTRIVAIVFLAGASISLMHYVRPNTLAYNISIVEGTVESLATASGLESAPRKILAFTGFMDLLAQQPEIGFVGVGGGAYNSRTSFMLNGQYSAATPVVVRPTYAEQRVFPLWNPLVLSQAYSDGTMNQPFSSVLAVISEYGLPLFLVISWLYVRSFRAVSATSYFFRTKTLERSYFTFLYVAFAALCVFDNYIEYLEITFAFFAFSLAKRQGQAVAPAASHRLAAPLRLALR